MIMTRDGVEGLVLRGSIRVLKPEGAKEAIQVVLEDVVMVRKLLRGHARKGVDCRGVRETIDSFREDVEGVREVVEGVREGIEMLRESLGSLRVLRVSGFQGRC